MRRAAVRSVSCLLCALFLPAVSGSPEDSGDGAAKKISGFRLRDFRGREHSLDDFADSRAVVVVFLGTDCPLAKLYGPRLADLHRTFRDRGVSFVGIDSNRQDTLARLAHYARTHGIRFPLLRDAGSRVADLFGALRTPEAFVLDADRVVRYRGRIDDQYGVGYARAEPDPDASWLSLALEEVLAGREVSTARVEPVGCFIGRAPEKAPEGKITYSKHIAPILNRRCVECHREGEIAPFPLTSYREVAGWEETIREVIEDGRMPPWHADAPPGEFLNDSRLTERERELIFAWADDGAPEGDPADLPSPPRFVDGWRIPRPDFIVEMPEPWEVPAEGVVPYQYFVVDPGWDEGRWIRAAEARPGNRSVVHHLILFYVAPRDSRPKGELAITNTIGAMAPGMPPTVYPEAMAKYVPPRSKLVFQLHYTPNGTACRDRSRVGLVFADPGTVRKEVRTHMVMNDEFRIPPRAPDHVVTAEHRFRQDVLLFSLLPHMHYRGKAFRFEAVHRDARRETLLNVPRYDFNWQNVYFFAKPREVGAGTLLHCTARFDNSGENLLNPDPDVEVRWGEQTWDEMMIGSFDYVLADQDLSFGPPRAQRLADGRFEVVFRYPPRDGTRSVHLVGSFNDWDGDTYPLERSGDEGAWETKLVLGQGEHEYKFLVNGNVWKADPGNRLQKGFFNNSVLRLEER